MIGFGGDQKTVDETRGGAWLCDGGHHDSQVNIGSDDVRGLAQVDRLADNHIITWFDLLDDARILAWFLFKLHIVAHGHGIGAADAIQTDLAAQAALPLSSLFVEDDVPAARRFDDLA